MQSAFLQNLLRRCDRNGQTPLAAAAQGGHKACVQMLMQSRACDNCVRPAKSALVAAIPRWPVVSLLLGARADAHADFALVRCSAVIPKSDCELLSMRACIEGLLAFRASPDATDENG